MSYIFPCFEIRHQVLHNAHPASSSTLPSLSSSSSLSPISSSSWAPKLGFIDPCFEIKHPTLHIRVAQYQRQSEDIKVAFMITFETVTLCSWLVYAVYVSCCVESRQRMITGQFVGCLALVTFCIKRGCCNGFGDLERREGGLHLVFEDWQRWPCVTHSVFCSLVVRDLWDRHGEGVAF